MTYEHILVDTEDGVGIVTLNRPDKLNAMNRKLAGELHDAVRQMDADDAIGCIVIRSGTTPNCSVANIVPVRPKPLITSSMTSNTPCVSQISRTRCQ